MVERPGGTNRLARMRNYCESCGESPLSFSVRVVENVQVDPRCHVCDQPPFRDPQEHQLGRICAECGQREVSHGDNIHPFAAKVGDTREGWKRPPQTA